MNKTLISNTPHNLIKQSGQVYEIEKFPKEFERDWFHSLDFRFISIFFCTFIFTAVLVRYLYFKSTLSENFPPVQHAYVHFFDNRQFYDSIEDVFVNDKSVQASSVRETSTLPKKIHSMETQQPESRISQKGKSISSNNEFGAGNADDSVANNQPDSDNGSAALNKNESFAISDTPDSLLAAIELRMQNTLASAEQNHTLLLESTHKSNQYKIRGVRTDNLLRKDTIQSIVAGEKKQIDGYPEPNNTKNENWSDIPSSASKKNKNGNKSLRTGDAISRVILSHNRTIQDCYKQSLKRDPKLRGKITIRFSVSTEGYVKEVKILKSTLNDAILETCIVSRIKKWKNFGVISNGSDEIYYRQSFVFGKE